MSTVKPIYEFKQGSAPLLISVPHAGQQLPPGYAEHLTGDAGSLPDTDWFVDELYAFAIELGASLLTANYSRYVVDLNRPPDDRRLYQNSAASGLVPLNTFDGMRIYLNEAPNGYQRQNRLTSYWMPYHRRLRQELTRQKRAFGYALLLDAHSIAPEIPALFDGRLPDFNLGSNDGRSADPRLIDCAWQALDGEADYSAVRDGRFKGGYITRHYGQPEHGMHALQLELSQATYLQSRSDPVIDDDRRGHLLNALQRFTEVLIGWQPGDG